MTANLFVRVPESLYDALWRGEITPVMFNIMCLLHRWANWHTGVVRTCSSERLATAMGADSFDGTPDQIPSIRTIQRSMQGLCEAGWFISGYHKGSKKPYSVEICNYIPVADGDGDVTLIRPTETTSWTETGAFQGGDEVADGGGEKAARRRGKGGLNEIVNETSDKTSSETSVNKTSGVEVSQSEQSPTSSASSVTTASQSITQDNPIEEAKPRQVSYSELEIVKSILFKKCDMYPNQACLQAIFDAHPDFVWDYGVIAVVLARLKDKGWVKNIKTPSDFAFWWNSSGDGSLFAQVCRDLPDPTPVQSSAAKSFDMTIEDLREPAPEPELETLEQTTARTRAFEIYDGCEIPAVVDAFAKKNARYRRFPNLYGYHNGTNWSLGSSLEEVRENCDSEKEKVTA